MNCQECGSALSAMARFCPICGTAVEATAPPPPPGVIAPPPPPPPPTPPPPPPPYPAAQGYPQPAYGYAQPTRTNGMAIAAMVLGILWLYWIGSVLALIFGYIAKSQIDQSAGTQSGRGMAIAGIVLGWVGIAFLVITIVAVIATA